MLMFAGALAMLVAGLIDGMRMPQAAPLLMMLVVAASVRAIAAWLWELVGSSGAMRVKAQLRAELLTALERRPAGVPGFPTARVATLLGPGLDALDGYFGTYLPQLVLTAFATPILIVATWIADPLSGVVLVIVLPLIPVFMALIGMATGAVQRRQWESLSSLSRGFLEVVGGLSTLIVYNRAERQTRRIRAVTDEYRSRTMKVLRITFLSGFTLEFAASLSVALVAVSIGLRLVAGDLTLAAGLFVLVLAPEVFLPLRNVGAAFHASAEGVAAASDAFELLEATEPDDAADSNAAVTGRAERDDGVPLGMAGGLELVDVRVRRGERIVVDGVHLEAPAGQVVAVTGESGAGKSTLFAAILGFVDVEGEIRLGGHGIAGDRTGIAWAGQTPKLRAGSVAENVRLGDESAPPVLLWRALRLASVDLDPGHRLGAGGSGLSGGQAQRVATARAIHRLLARDGRLLLLDEPSSALDPAREAELARHLRELADDGRTIVVSTHRNALIEAADTVIDLAVVHA